MKAVTADQMRAIEAGAVKAGVSLDHLMENAGLAVADAVERGAGPVYGKRIVVLVGPGNTQRTISFGSKVISRLI